MYGAVRRFALRRSLGASSAGTAAVGSTRRLLSTHAGMQAAAAAATTPARAAAAAASSSTAAAAGVRHALRTHAVLLRLQRRWLSTDGDKPMTAAERKAAFMAAQKAQGSQWAAFSGNKNESTLSAADRAQAAADDAKAAAGAGAGAGGAAAADGKAAAAATEGAADGAGGGAAGADAAASAAAAKKKASRTAFNLGKELQYIREYLNRNNVQATSAGLQKRRLKKGETPAEVLAKQPVSNMVANTDEKALVFVETVKTVWEERIENLRDSLSASAPMRGGRQIKHTLQTSENPMIERSRASYQALLDKIEDWRNVYDESQHPLIYRVRDVQDKVMGETDTAFALGQLRKVDPAFDQEQFVKYMEEYMIPRVIDAYLKPEASVLRLVTEGNAARFMAATMKEREVQGHYWDTRTLDLHSVEMKDATVVDDTPLLVLTFMCQHVECVRDAKGKIVQGHESNLKMAYWSWVVRRDFENPFFDWKIVELSTQRVHSLV